jgi:signal transduction histidine kinase
MDKKTVLYRVMQELINNTLKYAKAGKIDIQFLIQNKTITLQYKDNGKGFEPEKVKKGVGLNSINSRIQYHKGTMELTSAPGAGTLIIVTMPI